MITPNLDVYAEWYIDRISFSPAVSMSLHIFSSNVGKDSQAFLVQQAVLIFDKPLSVLFRSLCQDVGEQIRIDNIECNKSEQKITYLINCFPHGIINIRTNVECKVMKVNN